MGATVVEKVQAGVITSFPSGTLHEAIASKQAEEPEFTKRPNFLPNSLET
jgi:hypothetical protein